MWLSLANASPPFISYMVRNSLPQKIQKGQFENVWNMGVASFEDCVSTLMAQFLFQLSFKSSIKHHRQPSIGCVSSKDLHQL
ncbi:hypothetical protein NC653_004982 [Populus alba x Populus x berolinensis]|uniref:Uncharacterized protein n=1 Tax=Populus alba x Populus x berolinensis TaxID=444605 RepID=A0AAD6RAU6_9ROSI|nr:hypothetical protein NC653_004976 [Populus alba x Populus x berolinensis]KAJ7005524.1 hypothetical protein NC653_004982 [Populus alba x Populus x berolinensis]